jgi:lipopolysaccharide export system protein LptA
MLPVPPGVGLTPMPIILSTLLLAVFLMLAISIGGPSLAQESATGHPATSASGSVSAASASNTAANTHPNTPSTKSNYAPVAAPPALDSRLPIAAPTSRATSFVASVPASGAASAGTGDSKTAPKGAGANPFSSLSLSDHGPIDIHSDSLAMDYKNSLVSFRGNVHATQGSTALVSDTLSVIYGSNLKEIKQIIAQGNVRVSQGGRWVTGQRAVLNQVDHTVEMTGDPVIHDGPDQVAGSKILIYLDSQKTQIDGARAMIFPRKSQTRDNDLLSDHD